MSRLLVLGWHNVQPTWCFPAPDGAGERGLARQLRWLDRVAHVVPLRPALEQLAAGERLPARAVALTFDDGYADNLALAAPLLARLGLPATFFLLPGLLDRQVGAWWEDLAWAFTATRRRRIDHGGQTLVLAAGPQRREAYRTVAEQLKRVDRETRDREVQRWVERLDPAGEPPAPGLFLDWDGARRLVGLGFDVGSHSTAHAIQSRETPQAQADDLGTAADALRQRLGVPVDLLAYPNGRAEDYDAGTLAAARAAGHRFAVTTQAGRAGPRTAPLEVPRSVVAADWDLATTVRNLRWSWQELRARRRQG